MKQNNRLDANDYGDVAVVGMACRFPGANNIEMFWNNLCAGTESVQFFSDDEVRCAGVSVERMSKPGYVKAGAVIDDVDKFDAAFFGISPKEARYIDPQHRLFIECAWSAMEAAGYGPGSHPRATGVYAAANISNYLLFNVMPASGSESINSFQVMLGNDKDYLATYVSYKFDLRGPSMAVQTACSSSLVAVHLACQGLLDGQCDMALAGGVSLNLPERAGYDPEDAVILSPDGHCRAFDAKAKGTVVGDGVGVVVLKRLEDAIANRDTIHAVIRGTASNNDGSAKVGFTAPSVDGQAGVIAEALEMARTTPESIDYIEAHGTGTVLGDMVELAALTQVFGDGKDTSFRCALGSVKSNIGHLWTAAGIAGFIKAVLMLERRMLVPSLHFQAPHPQSSLTHGRFYINTKLCPWESKDRALCAGVSAFGIGGTNAHVILEEPPRVESSSPSVEDERHILVLSAKTSASLTQMAQDYDKFFVSNPGLSIGDSCYTASVGRVHHAYRLAIHAANFSELQNNLRAYIENKLSTAWLEGHTSEAAARRLVFVCPSTPSPTFSAHYLYSNEPAFRHTWYRCEEVLRRQFGRSGLPLLADPDDNSKISARSELLFTCAMSIALADLWRSWGVQPSLVLGFGIGEYAAAAIAGVLSIEDAMSLVANHSQLIPENGNRASHELPGYANSYDFHLREPGLSYIIPRIDWLSSVDARLVTQDELNSGEYWARIWQSSPDTRGAVSFFTSQGYRSVVELGTGKERSDAIDELIDRVSGMWCVTLSKTENEKAVVNQALTELYVSGVAIDWRAYYQHQLRRRVILPTYPFERTSHWIAAPTTNRVVVSALQDSEKHPLLGKRIRSVLRPRQYENDGNQVLALMSLSGSMKSDIGIAHAVLIEMLLAATCDTFSVVSVNLENMELLEALTLLNSPLLHTVVTPDFSSAIVEVYAGHTDEGLRDPQWQKLARAVVRATPFASSPDDDAYELDAIRHRCVLVTTDQTSPNNKISWPERWRGDEEWLLHRTVASEQTLVDFRSMVLALNYLYEVIAPFNDNYTENNLFTLRVSVINRISVIGNDVWVYVRRNEQNSGMFDVRFLDGQGSVALALLGVEIIDTQKPIAVLMERDVEKNLRSEIIKLSIDDRVGQIRVYLREQVSRVLGIPEDQIPLEQNMIELGMDSLSFVEIANVVRRDFCVELKPSNLHEHSSVAAIASYLSTQLMAQGSTPQSLQLVTKNNDIVDSVKLNIKSETSVSMPETASSGCVSSMVRIHAKGHKPPLFCLHPSGGQVFVYHHLVANVGVSRPILGIQSRALNDYRLEHLSLDEMAADYAELIRQHYPDGPYHLLGWSMGGRLAITIAALLEQADAELGFVGLWDSRVPTPDFSADLDEPIPGITMAYGGAMLNAISALTPEERKAMRDTSMRAKPDERLKSMILWAQDRGVLPPDIPFSILFQQAALVDQHVALLDAQTPAKVNCDLYVWWARNVMQRWPITDWGLYTNGTVHTNIVDGDHFSMVRPPQIHVPANQLKAILHQIELGSKPSVEQKMSTFGGSSIRRDHKD